MVENAVSAEKLKIVISDLPMEIHLQVIDHVVAMKKVIVGQKVLTLK